MRRSVHHSSRTSTSRNFSYSRKMLALLSRAFGWAERRQPRNSSVSGLLRRFVPLLGRRPLMECVQHLGTLPLTTQSSLAVIRFNDETLLLGITPQAMTVIAKAPSQSKQPDHLPTRISSAPSPMTDASRANDFDPEESSIR